MKLNIWWIIILAFILFALVRQCEGDNTKKFRERINKLEKQNDSLRNDSMKKYNIILSLNDSIDIKNGQLKALYENIDLLKRKRYEIPKVVDNLNDVQLDSILTNYRHPNRD